MRTAPGSRVVDIASPAFKANPWPACAGLRDEQPVVRTVIPGGRGEGYLVTRYEEAIRVLRDDETFVKDVRHGREPGRLGGPWVPPFLRPLSHTLLDSDGAEHRRLRTLVRDTFASHYIERLVPRVQAIVDQLLDRLALRRSVDLVADYAVPAPLTLIAEILGVSERDRFRFRRWFSSLTELGASDRPGLLMLFKLPQVILMMRFLHRLIAERRARPRDDLVSRLAAV